MKLKLNKISVKPFVLLITVINVLMGFFLGLIVTIASLIAPEDPDVARLGPWSVLVFPIFNGVLTFLASLFLASVYNFFANKLGGVIFEFENIE